MDPAITITLYVATAVLAVIGIHRGDMVGLVAGVILLLLSVAGFCTAIVRRT